MDKSGSAFPSHGSMGEVAQEGMSLRDWFAGQALVGMGNWTPNQASIGLDKTAESKAMWAYQLADAMLKTRESNHAEG